MGPGFIREYLSPDGLLDETTLRAVGYLRLLAVSGGLGAQRAESCWDAAPSPKLAAVTYVIPYFVLLGWYFIVRYGVLGSLGGIHLAEGRNVALQIDPAAFMRDVLGLAGGVWPSVPTTTARSSPSRFSTRFSFTAFPSARCSHWASSESGVSGGLRPTRWVCHGSSYPCADPQYPSSDQSVPSQVFLFAGGGHLHMSCGVLYRFARGGNRVRSVLVTGGLAGAIVLSGASIVGHNAALSRTGSIARALVDSFRSNPRDISAASRLTYLTFPVAPGEIHRVPAEAFMHEVLGASGVRTDVPYGFVVFVRDAERSAVAVTRQQDGAFLVDIVGKVECFWMPKEPSALEAQMQRMYPAAQVGAGMVPLPRQGVVETNGARITVVRNDPIANVVRVRIELDDSTGDQRWFLYDQRGFRVLPTP